jgi:rhodanese-related sulfurtransferase
MIQSISPQQAQELIAFGELDIVDVRDPSEWSRGHLPGARLVPLNRLRADLQTLLPRDGIIFVCAVGMRSETAARLAEASGRQKLYNLSGGTRSWVSAGLPLVRD